LIVLHKPAPPDAPDEGIQALSQPCNGANATAVRVDGSSQACALQQLYLQEGKCMIHNSTHAFYKCVCVCLCVCVMNLVVVCRPTCVRGCSICFGRLLQEVVLHQYLASKRLKSLKLRISAGQSKSWVKQVIGPAKHPFMLCHGNLRKRARLRGCKMLKCINCVSSATSSRSLKSRAQ